MKECRIFKAGVDKSATYNWEYEFKVMVSFWDCDWIMQYKGYITNIIKY